MKEKLLIFGSGGLVGSSVSRLVTQKYSESFDIFSATRKDANLFSLDETRLLIEKEKPSYIINAAAKVGGIVANNTERTEFILENLKININILESIINYPEIKVVNLGSSCIYPLDAPNPISESSLMTGKLEPTNSPYAMAKLTAIEIGDALSKQYGHNITNLMPTNLYGPNDNYQDNESHVFAALIKKFVTAEINNLDQVVCWGDGTPKREFLHVDDLADASVFCLENFKFSLNNCSFLNVGTGKDISIFDLAMLIKNKVGFKGSIIWDKTKPNGTPLKRLDITRIENLGWKNKISLEEGIEKTIKDFKKNMNLSF